MTERTKQRKTIAVSVPDRKENVDLASESSCQRWIPGHTDC